MKHFTEQDIAKIGDRLVIYADRDELVHAPMWWHLKGLSETASGYGRKLNSGYKISFEGRLYRVYTTIFSNSGSNWFKTKERIVFIG